MDWRASEFINALFPDYSTGVEPRGEKRERVEAYVGKAYNRDVQRPFARLLLCPVSEQIRHRT